MLRKVPRAPPGTCQELSTCEPLSSSHMTFLSLEWRESQEISKTGNSPAKGGEWGAAPRVPEHRVGGAV